jgi:hypothetical protein
MGNGLNSDAAPIYQEKGQDPPRELKNSSAENEGVKKCRLTKRKELIARLFDN